MWRTKRELPHKGGFPEALVVPPALETAFNHDMQTYMHMDC